MKGRSANRQWTFGLGLGAALLLSACADNQYGPPDGPPKNFGQQHYLDNQQYQQLNLIASGLNRKRAQLLLRTEAARWADSIQ